MTVRVTPLLCLAIALLVAAPCSATNPPTWGDLERGPYGIGFRLLDDSDPSRFVRTDSTSDAVVARPMRVWLWYPAAPGTEAKAMRFGRYAEIADHDVWPETVLPAARKRMAYAGRPLSRSLGGELFAALLQQPVGAVEEAAAASGRFPLIVVGQGLYYESPVSHAILCELLASHGFVVATVALAGTHSPQVHLDEVDLETQVRDMEWVIARAGRLSFVSPDRVGALGFDLGAMAAVILAMRCPQLDALASLDGGVLYGHPAGIPESSHHHNPMLLRVPWLHSTQRRFGTRPANHQGPDLFSAAVFSERYLMLVDGVGHADFTSYALIEERNPVLAYWGPRRGGERQRYEAVCAYLVRFFSGYLGNNRASREQLTADPDNLAPGLGITVEHRQAAAPRPVYSDLLNALLSGEPDRAAEMARSIRGDDPDGPLLNEAVLNRLGYHFLSCWQMADEAIEVFKLNVELHPESLNTYDSLGEGYLLAGDRDNALRWFQKVLELDPDNERAKELIEQLTTEAKQQ